MFNTATSSPHVHGPNNVSRVMLQVVIALVPAMIAYTVLFGWGVLINFAIATVVALGCEAAVLALRKRPIADTLSDGSALVTAALLAIALPPLAPWWLVTVGVAFAMVFAKHLYGGMGYNPFNPAMVGYVVLLISFPVEMTRWMSPEQLRDPSLGLLASLHYVFSDNLPAGLSVDALTMATPLDAVKTQLGLNRTLGEILQSPTFGVVGGRGWEVVNGLFLAGGLFLMWRRVITWHVPVGLLGTLFLITGLFHAVDPDTYVSPVFQIFDGGAMLGAFFIATDPVSGATSPRGRLIFGAGCGLIIFVIRTWGGYPDGVAFSVLLMNMAAPTIDYYTQPRVFGHSRSEG